MKPRAPLLAVLSLLMPAVYAGDAVKARQLMTLMRADEVMAAAMKSGLRNTRTGIDLSIAQLACLNAVPHSQFSNAVTTALAEGLSNAELDAAIRFYRTPAGGNYAKSIVTVVQGSAQPLPLNDADAASVREFADSPVGDKLLKKALIPNSNVVADRMAQVSADAIENCGKGAAK